MKRVGILGSGQLARFLALEAHRLDIPCGCFGANLNDPAALIQRHFTHGEASDKQVLGNFISSYDVTTFESEFFDMDALAPLENSKATEFAPALSVMKALQDRYSQKSTLLEHGLPTLSFLQPKDANELRDFWAAHKKGLVLKKRRFGYDGYGTFILRRQADLESFLQAHADLSQFIAEPLVRFRRELAAIVYRSSNGDTGSFPLVEWKAKDAKCWWVKGPVKDRRFEKLKPKLLKFLKSIDYVGVMAFEMFDTHSDLSINEIAPRVHNSGHYSLNATPMSQFAIHLLCVAGESVPKSVTATTGGFAMVNLIGTSEQAPKLRLSPSTWLHWYEKSQNRAGRKMGHINAVAKTPDEALKLALRSSKLCRL